MQADLLDKIPLQQRPERRRHGDDRGSLPVAD
jgi:hypothetical protein